jgi:hypothetical protein
MDVLGVGESRAHQQGERTGRAARLDLAFADIDALIMAPVPHQSASSFLASVGTITCFHFVAVDQFSLVITVPAEWTFSRRIRFDASRNHVPQPTPLFRLGVIVLLPLLPVVASKEPPLAGDGRKGFVEAVANRVNHDCMIGICKLPD